MLSHYDAIKQVRTNLNEKIEALVLRLGDATHPVRRDSLKYDLEVMQGTYADLTNDMLILAQCEREPDYHWSH